jgi:hypothetical protein
VIRHSPTLSELRFFEAANPPPMAPFDACCLVVWETERVIWLRMLHGRLTRKLMRELLAWLVERGVDVVRSHRATGHVLPLGVERSDGSWETRVADLAARFNSECGHEGRDQ